MYNLSKYIETPVGNNAFSYEKRKNKRLFIPALKKIEHFDAIELGNEIVFEEDDGNGSITGYTGLKHIYEIQGELSGRDKRESPGGDFLKNIPAKIYLFDNHNHAYFFWHLARLEGIVENNATLFHIDEHADMRNPEVFLSQEDLQDKEKIYNYTNFILNVGNYIIPAEKDGLLQKTYQIRSETALREILALEIHETNIILNLDLDFFHPDLDFIPYSLKKEVILKLAKKSKLITVASSPYFIDQTLAIKVFKDIFS